VTASLVDWAAVTNPQAGVNSAAGLAGYGKVVAQDGRLEIDFEVEKVLDSVLSA
jgi:hypothetical protein